MGYSIGLFLHILGTILMFMGVGITLAAMLAMLFSRDVAQVRIWALLAKKADGLLPFSVIFILVPGIYLVITTWGWSFAWVNISLVVLIVMTAMGPAINLKRIKAIDALANSNSEQDGKLSFNLYQLIRDRVLWTSVSVMTFMAFAIVWLMTVKPGILGSFIALVASILIGFLVSRLAVNKGFTYEEIDSNHEHSTIG